MITLIMAASKNGGVGFQGKLPWKCMEDMAFFKRATLGGVVITGGETFRSMGKLPNRTIIVLSKTMPKHTGDKSVLVVRSVNELITLLGFLKNRKVFCIGGSKVADLLSEYITDAFITTIDIEVEADTFLPTVLMDMRGVFSIELSPLASVEYFVKK